MAFRKREYQDSVEQIYKSNQPNYIAMGGFLVEEEEEQPKKHKHNRQFEEELDDLNEQTDNPPASSVSQGQNGDNEFGEGGVPICNVCTKLFPFSYMFDKFKHHACDNCRCDNPANYKLMTRTEAKNHYLLKDCDLDARKPKLLFEMKKNPHNPRWGDMKLYLRLHIEKRAIEVWGSLDNLNEEREKKDSNREKLREKKFEKQVKELRNEMRADMNKKREAPTHIHEFGEEKYNQKDDTYSKKCTTCNHVLTYEKM